MATKLVTGMHQLTTQEHHRVSGPMDEEMKRLPLERSLQDSVDSLFRPISQDGFWDESEGKVIDSLLFKLGENGQVV